MAVLLLCSFSSARRAAPSTGLALVARKEETLIATVNMLLTPLMFLSAVFMRLELMPSWIQTVARYNPVNWSVAAGRGAMQSSVDWAWCSGTPAPGWRSGLSARRWRRRPSAPTSGRREGPDTGEGRGGRTAAPPLPPPTA